MKNFSIKNKMMLVTTLVFLILLGFFNLYVYSLKNKQQNTNIQKQDQQLHQMLQTIKKHNTHIFLSRLENIKKFDYFKNIISDLKDGTYDFRQDVSKSFLFNFQNLQSQTNFVKSLHIIDKNGLSYLRAHRLEKYKDPVHALRQSVKTGINTPVSRSFFEDGVEGFLFRIVSPIFDNNEFLGLLEIGLDPHFLLNRINHFTQMPSVIYKKEQGKSELFTTALEQQDQKIDLKNTYEKTPQGYIQNQEKDYFVHSIDIKNFSGNKAGVMLFYQDISQTQKSFENFVIVSVMASIVLMMVLLLVLNKFFTLLLNRIDKLFYIINNTQESIIVIDANTFTIDFVNDAAKQNLQYKEKELRKISLDTLFTIPNSTDSKQKLTTVLAQMSKNHQAINLKTIVTTKSNKQFPMQMSLNYVQKDDGYILGICKDLTDTLEQELRQRVNETMINKYIPLSHTDLTGVITYTNDALCTLTGYTREELLGKSHKKLRSPNTSSTVYKQLWQTIKQDQSYSGELEIVKKDSQKIWVRILIEPRYDINGKKIGYVSTREDVTDREKLRYISEHDQLTGAFNRRSFELKMEALFERAHTQDEAFGVVMFDIDHFKQVNDTYGHQVGDEILIKASNAIKQSLSEDDFFARWGGEEFIVVIKSSQIKELIAVVEKIQKTMSHTDFAPVDTITASFGVTLHQKSDTKDSLLVRVDDALYLAKENGRNRYEIAQ